MAHVTVLVPWKSTSHIQGFRFICCSCWTRVYEETCYCARDLEFTHRSYFPILSPSFCLGGKWRLVKWSNWRKPDRDNDNTGTQALWSFGCYLEMKIINLEDHSIASGGNHKDISVGICICIPLAILTVELIQMYFNISLRNNVSKMTLLELSNQPKPVAHWCPNAFRRRKCDATRNRFSSRAALTFISPAF